MLLRVVQVALLGAWIIWRQPWRATSPEQQRLGRLVMVMVAVLLFPAVATLFLHSDWIDVLPYYLVTTVCLLQIFWLSRRGLVRFAAFLLTLMLIVQQIGISALSSSNGIVPASAPLIYGSDHSDRRFYRGMVVRIARSAGSPFRYHHPRRSGTDLNAA